MADEFISAGADDGQSIPAMLAATPSAKKPRIKAKPMADAPIAESPLATLIEAEAEIEAALASEAALSSETALADIAATSVPEPEITPEVTPAIPAAAPASAPPAAVPADSQKETVMATTIENVTTDTNAKAQAMFADVNDRAKGAMAKSAKAFEDMNAFGKGNVEALVESSKIAAKGIETLGQDAAEFARKSIEDATAAMKTLATVKSPTEFMKLQGDYMRSAFDAMVAETSRSTETMLKLVGEVVQPISNRVAVAADTMKIAA
ncbi:phasin family protein [Sphingomonas sp.]|uniref:phasin family protein n=1 Tax=Sphingomonas sp. TaxID=28214 RepID=UPI0035BBD751